MGCANVLTEMLRSTKKLKENSRNIEEFMRYSRRVGEKLVENVGSMAEKFMEHSRSLREELMENSINMGNKLSQNFRNMEEKCGKF
ncbi:hypothetical protein Trydic_g22856 [Trypoxylus dichotomus]